MYCQSSVAGSLQEGASEKAVASSGPVSAITKDNLGKLKTLIIPELQELVRSGNVEIPVADRLDYEWRYDDQWIKNSYFLDSDPADGAKGGSVLAQKRGFPFGVTGASTKKDAHTARKLLWDGGSLWWWQKAINAGVNLIWLNSGKIRGRVAADFSRVYVPTMNPQDKTGQVFREVFKIYEPRPVSKFAFLTFRFFGDEEDMLWLFSPAINKTRQLTGSNRSDSLLRSSVSLDDFFLWSGKPELVDASFDRTMQVLAPYAALNSVHLEEGVPEKGCYSVQHQEVAAVGEGEPRWRFERGERLTDLLQFPAEAIFVLRELWRIELISRDPFSLYGRQVLYVDPVSMLPVYKVVFDLSGRLWKIVVGGFGLAISDDGTRRVPYPAFTAVADLIANQTSIIDYKKVVYCDDFVDGIQMTDFDPGKLGGEAESSSSSSSVASKRKKGQRE